MTLQELRYLVALADAGHFGRAALACHVTQSTLSIQIRKLEDYLGVPLFDRSLKSVEPTPVGQRIVASARRILEETTYIRTLARQAGQDPMDCTLRLGVIPTSGPYYLPKALLAVRRTFPRLRLLLREEMTTSLVAGLRENRFEAVLLSLPIEHDGLQIFPLFHEPFVAALPGAHPLARETTLAVSDLDRTRLLLLEEGHCLRDQALDVCGGATGMNEEVQATSLAMLREMVGMGLGITLLPALAMPPAARDDAHDVVFRPFSAPAPSRLMGLVWRQASPWHDPLHQLATHLHATLPDGVKAAHPHIDQST